MKSQSESATHVTALCTTLKAEFSERWCLGLALHSHHRKLNSLKKEERRLEALLQFLQRPFLVAQLVCGWMLLLLPAPSSESTSLGINPLPWNDPNPLELGFPRKSPKPCFSTSLWTLRF